MQAFIVEVENRPGSWADVAEKIADKGVNILGFTLAANGKGYVGLVGSDDSSTREALDELRGNYREVELLPVAIEHVPGTAAKIARMLGNAGINIELFMPTGESGGRIIAALGVDRVEDARRVLGNQVTSDFGSLWPKMTAHTARR
jgi:hypothetical protein